MVFERKFFIHKGEGVEGMGRTNGRATPPQFQALPVDESIQLDGPPATAEEYLLWVRQEARSVPDVMVSEVKAPSR